MVSVTNKTSMQNVVMLSVMVSLCTNGFNCPTTAGISKSRHTSSRMGSRSKLQWNQYKNFNRHCDCKFGIGCIKSGFGFANSDFDKYKSLK